MNEEQKLVKQINSLNKNIETLNAYLSKQHSPKWRFSMGIITGVGTALGASIIAGIVIFVLSRFIESIYELPGIGEQLPQEQIERLLEN